MTEHVTDQDLFNAWQAGDRDAGEALISKHYDAIEGFFRHKLPARSGDLVQRTFLVCAESASRFRGEGSFRAFVFGIARNVLYEALRGLKRDNLHEDFNALSLHDLAPGVSTLARRNAEQRLLVEGLRRIPLELQVLLELYYWEHLSVAELASAFGIPQGTVKSRLHRARTALREAMEQAATTHEERRSVASLVASWAQGLPSPDEVEGGANARDKA